MKEYIFSLLFVIMIVIVILYWAGMMIFYPIPTGVISSVIAMLVAAYAMKEALYKDDSS